MSRCRSATRRSTGRSICARGRVDPAAARPPADRAGPAAAPGHASVPRGDRGPGVDPRPTRRIEGRLVPGHYEGDLVVGPAGTTAAIGTLVERTSSHLTLFHLPDNRGAEAIPSPP